MSIQSVLKILDEREKINEKLTPIYGDEPSCTAFPPDIPHNCTYWDDKVNMCLDNNEECQLASDIHIERMVLAEIGVIRHLVMKMKTEDLNDEKEG